MRINDFLNINNELNNDFVKSMKSLLMREKLLTNDIDFDVIIN